MSQVRIPTQKRSIEKRNKIITKGFELICEKGYHNTNTKEIAKYAGVSTGIVYQYFNDKEEIFYEGIKEYSNELLNVVVDFFDKNSININNLDSILNDMIDLLIKNHKISKKAHNELIAMSHLNKKVSEYYKHQEINITKKLTEILIDHNINIDNSFEKMHIVYNLVDNLCHEITYHNHNEINYDIMKKEVISIIKSILKGN